MAYGTDEDKLRILLPHWIEHNAEHAAEFRQWAGKARGAGLSTRQQVPAHTSL